MSSLHETQSQFAKALVCDDSDTALLLHCAGSPEQVRAGINAYRRSVHANWSLAVAATYPVLATIVGHDFLHAAIVVYISHAVSRSGDLNRYGHDFSEFLSDYAPAQSLPYLPDVARLEWLSAQVYAAKDTPTQNVSCLIETPPAQWGMLSFTLDPAHAILASSWPLARIWEVNQPGYTGDFSVDLSPIPREFLIHRTEQGIAVSQIKIGDAVLLRALATARSLDDALIQALEADALFDLTASLHLLIAHGLLRYAYRTQGNAP